MTSSVKVGAIYRRVNLDGAANSECYGARVVVTAITGPVHDAVVEYRYLNTAITDVVCSSTTKQFYDRFVVTVDAPKPPEPEWSYSHADKLHADFVAAAEAFNEYLEKQPKQRYYPAMTTGARYD